MRYAARLLLLCCAIALAMPATAAPLSEQDAVISRQSDTFHIRVHYPRIGQSHVDADLLSWARQTVDTFLGSFSEEPEHNIPYELETSYTLTRPSPSVLSVVWKTASYTGGAHGNLEISSTTYDLKTGKLIDLYDVFKNLDIALDIMSRFCSRSIGHALGDMYNDDMLRTGTAPEAENYACFALTPSGIRIYFQPYQVAPWAAGPQVADIPLDELKDAEPDLSLWKK